MKFIKGCLLLISEGVTSFRLLPPIDTSSFRYWSAAKRPPLHVFTQPTDKASYSPDMPYEILPLKKVIESLTTTTTNHPVDHLHTGLTEEAATKLLAQVGPNALPPPAKKTIWELWLQQFDGEILRTSSYQITSCNDTLLLL